jgi:hypothetical protein
VGMVTRSCSAGTLSSKRLGALELWMMPLAVAAGPNRHATVTRTSARVTVHLWLSWSQTSTELET